MTTFKSQIKTILTDTDKQHIAIKTLSFGELKNISYDQLKRDVILVCEKLEVLGALPGMTAAMKYTNEYEVVVIDLAMILLGIKPFALPDDESFSLSDFEATYKVNILIQKNENQGRHWLPSDVENTAVIFKSNVYLIHKNHIEYSECTITYMFGSGTTGKPKCIEIVLDNCLGDFRLFSNAFNINKNDHFFVFLPLSVLQQRVMIYSTLLGTGTVCLSTPQEMLRSLRTMNPTIFVAPPLLYETLLDRFKSKTALFDKLTRGNLFDYLDGRSEGSIPIKILARAFGTALKKTFGGKIRFMLVGMAMSKLSTIQFFNRCGLPLYEAYGLSEAGVICTNTPENNKLGTVGKPLNPGTVKIDSEGQVVVHRVDNWSTRYLNVPQEENDASYLSNSIYATGDLGEFDEDGYLRLKGRKKTQIGLSSGYKVQPEPVEVAVANIAGVGNAVVLGQGRPFLIIVLSLANNYNDETKKRVSSYITEYNERVVSRARICDVIYTQEQFGVKNELLNRSLKVNRSNVELYFAQKIEELYRDKNAVFEV